MSLGRTAFKRARDMMTKIVAALALPLLNRGEAIGRIDAYRSRGKGRGAASRRYGNKAGKYQPHQGARERARRAK